MATNSPRTLSIKRKRGEAPVDSLLIEQTSIQSKRRLTEHSVIFRRVQSLHTPATPNRITPQPPTPRRFHFSREEGSLVLVEQEEAPEPSVVKDNALQTGLPPQQWTTPRKRPGTSAASKEFRASVQRQIANNGVEQTPEPSATIVNELEQFSAEVNEKEILNVSPVRKSYNAKYKPKVPALRYKDRIAGNAPKQDEDVDMIDGDFVYDTYVQDNALVDPLTGTIPESKGSIGVIVITDEDEDFWETYGQDAESDKEFETDDEDENAEDYYGADYPEDEVDSDDERDLYPYKFNHGSDEEEYDAENAAWSDGDDDDDLRYPRKRDARPSKDQDLDEFH